MPRPILETRRPQAPTGAYTMAVMSHLLAGRALVQRDPGHHQRDMPARSRRVGTWASTIAPIRVANMGSRASMRANVARDRRAMASWSVT